MNTTPPPAENDDANSAARLIDPQLLGTWLAHRGHIWQMDLLDAGRLESFASDRGVSFAHTEDAWVGPGFRQSTMWDLAANWRSAVHRLWQLGLLRADLVISARKLRDPGLIEVGRDDRRRYLYADARDPEPAGLLSQTALLRIPAALELQFHPFRYYVLLHLRRLLDPRISPGHVFDSEHYPEALRAALARIQRRFDSPETRAAVALWNDLAGLIVATEPYQYPPMFGQLRISEAFEDDRLEERRVALQQQIGEHWTEVAQLYRRCGADRIRQLHRQLTQNAHELDPNTNLQILLRLARPDHRLETKGRLGGAVLMQTMAEMLRRATEAALNLELPEEDEHGFAWRPPGMKQERYGGARVFDGNRRVGQRFLRRFDFDYGIRLRWYVEGDTEYGAVRRLIAERGATEIQAINLNAEFVESRQKGLAFARSLAQDKESEIFSWISLDADKEQNVRVVEKAAKDDRLCGMFWVARPDFEFGNFDLEELEEVLLSMLPEHQRAEDLQAILHAAVASTGRGKALFNAIQTIPELAGIAKGEAWGAALMDYALQHPARRSTQVLRPLFEAAQLALTVDKFDHYRMCKEKRVEYRRGPVYAPSYGRLVPRDFDPAVTK